MPLFPKGTFLRVSRRTTCAIGGRRGVGLGPAERLRAALTSAPPPASTALGHAECRLPGGVLDTFGAVTAHRAVTSQPPPTALRGFC
eukprot:7390363-Prymnesium_polylepis.3